MLGFVNRVLSPRVMPLGQRCNSSLAKLRKSTGYSISNCKKALEVYPENVSKAEEWLHAQAKQQGWSKWAKIQARSASQGLIGVLQRDKIGVMVEVNCETDFVARNEEFQQFVEKVLNGCINQITEYSLTEDVTKTFLNETQLNEIKHESSTLGELVTSAVNKFNEKTVLKRAICVKVKEDIKLSCLTHPNTPCPNLSGASLGKYGTLLAYKHKPVENVNEKELSLNICQHVIGMNPSAVGELTEKDILHFQKEKVSDTIEVSDQEKTVVDSVEATEVSHEDNPETEGQDSVNIDVKDSDDTRLLFQPFLLEPTMTVGETVFKSGLDIVDFERFECGENLVGEEAKECASVAN